MIRFYVVKEKDILPGSHPDGRPVRSWGASTGTQKSLIESAEGCKPGIKCDMRDLNVARHQQPLRMSDPVLDDITDESDPVVRLNRCIAAY